MITAIACWLSTRATNGKLVEPVGLLDPDVFMVVFQRLSTTHVDPAAPEPCLDIAGVLSLQHWTVLAMFESSETYRSRLAIFTSAMNVVHQPYITQRMWQCRRAIQSQGYGICPSRLGNLVISSGSQPMTLVAIL